jgi:hypothetical protein
MTRACGADDIKNILYPALFRKLRFQMIDDTCVGDGDALDLFCAYFSGEVRNFAAQPWLQK